MKNKRRLKLMVCVLLAGNWCAAQMPADTVLQNQDTLRATVSAFEISRNANLASYVKVIGNRQVDYFNKSSLVQAFNTVAGVRMEERSPGSYRLNIRGSSLRSPFGVRNVKTYYNSLPLTDPGGNTYFNQLATNNFSTLEIVKGPAGSMYGAGTGGLVLINSFNYFKPSVELEYGTGSYDLQNMFATIKYGKDDNKNIITYAHNQTNGYRTQSKMRRDNISWNTQLKASDRQQLQASVLYTDMQYQTPGGLTLAEFTAHPRAARPAAGTTPSAEDAKATIYQKTFLTGFTNKYKFTDEWENTTLIYGAYNNIRNPTVRNYEQRSEPHFGGRSFFSFNKKMRQGALKWVTGGEYQRGNFNTQVSGNNNGNIDTLQTDDDIKYIAYNVFSQIDISLPNDWFITLGASINNSKASITRVSQRPVNTQSSNFKNEFAPRLVLQKIFARQFSMTGIVSRGFSPPTVSELLPSTGNISTELQAEHGINYEAGVQWNLLKNKLNLGLTAFHFALKDALVQRRDSSGADYYVNAGSTNQQGLEASASYIETFKKNLFVNSLQLNANYTYSHFRYGDYRKASADLSGKILPSVPSNALSLLAEATSATGIYLQGSYYFASSIYLNDENTAKAKPYHICDAKIGYRIGFFKKIKINIYAGANNLFNETYSLGNDINDARGRYYNAAAKRNYFAGVGFLL